MPFLVIMKLAPSRGVDIGDLSRMLGRAGEIEPKAVREVVGRYMPEAVEDLEALIEVGSLEFEV